MSRLRDHRSPGELHRLWPVDQRLSWLATSPPSDSPPVPIPRPPGDVGGRRSVRVPEHDEDDHDQQTEERQGEQAGPEGFPHHRPAAGEPAAPSASPIAADHHPPSGRSSPPSRSRQDDDLFLATAWSRRHLGSLPSAGPLWELKHEGEAKRVLYVVASRAEQLLIVTAHIQRGERVAAIPRNEKAFRIAATEEDADPHAMPSCGGVPSGTPPTREAARTHNLDAVHEPVARGSAGPPAGVAQGSATPGFTDPWGGPLAACPAAVLRGFVRCSQERASLGWATCQPAVAARQAAQASCQSRWRAGRRGVNRKAACVSTPMA